MNAAAELRDDIGTAAACRALEISRATFYRHLNPRESRPALRPAPPLALSLEESRIVIDLLHSERFVDKTPYHVYADLLDEGIYHCSVRTMYRLLKRAHGDVKERRRQVQRPRYSKPELLATGANQVWSWDISKLKSPAKWTYYYLYVIMDIFSRYVVGAGWWPTGNRPPWPKGSSNTAAANKASHPISWFCMPTVVRA